jgi:SpoVK/Ycf46/Vps4 family AAA+-type ATPase
MWSHKGSVLVILDDLEHLFGGQSLSDPGSHLLCRCQSTMLALIDSIREASHTGTSVLMIFTTSAQEIGTKFIRFDRIFRLEPPDEQERKALIASLFLLNYQREQASQTEQLLLDLVGLTVGRSYAELVQYCRQSIESMVEYSGLSLSTDSQLPALVALKERLQTITPQSLRGGVMDDYVDMRVLAARDLLSSTGNSGRVTEGGYDLPLRGNSAANAWKALQSSIIIPLCRTKELYDLLDESSNGAQKNIIGSILLSGEPGSGKSEIAMHCARYAAQLLPSVKIIDVSCTSLIHKEVGGSEKAVHHLFDACRSAAPCILLMDGIENVGAIRGNDATTEGTMDRVLSTLLVELDGVEDSPSGQHGGIAVIAITHDARWIDPALKRPGRLDRAVHLSRDWV